MNITVVKRNGDKEAYDANKINLQQRGWTTRLRG